MRLVKQVSSMEALATEARPGLSEPIAVGGRGRLPRRARPQETLMKLLWSVAVVVTMTGCSSTKAAPAAPPPREIEVVSLAPHEVRDTGEYLGSLLSRQSVTVLPQVAGYVRKILVRPGQQVVEGAPLVEVDAREDTAALDSAQAQLSSSKVNLELARRTLARTEALNKEGLASAQELEGARERLRPLSGVLAELPRVVVGPEGVAALRHGRDLGRRLVLEGFPEAVPARVRVMDEAGALLALAVPKGFEPELARLGVAPVLHPDVVLLA